MDDMWDDSLKAKVIRATKTAPKLSGVSESMNLKQERIANSDTLRNKKSSKSSITL